jgi:hypothetical protein
MSRVSLVFAICLLAGCSIPSEFIHSDGVLTVEMTGKDMYRIGNYRYTTGSLEVAMQLLSRSTAFKSVDLYIPSEIAHQPELPCQFIAIAIEKSRRPWTFYTWTPGHPETMVPTECEYAVLAHHSLLHSSVDLQAL